MVRGNAVANAVEEETRRGGSEDPEKRSMYTFPNAPRGKGKGHGGCYQAGGRRNVEEHTNEFHGFRRLLRRNREKEPTPRVQQ